MIPAVKKNIRIAFSELTKRIEIKLDFAVYSGGEFERMSAVIVLGCGPEEDSPSQIRFFVWTSFHETIFFCLWQTDLLSSSTERGFQMRS